MQGKQIYSPVPARAMGDPALSGADLRVLMAIASHDRFGNNGTGCFASHARIASITKLHSKAVARSVGRLRDEGFITIEKNPLNGRLVIYRVVYSEEDAAAMRGDGRPGVRPTRPKAIRTGSSSVTDDGEIGSSTVTDDGSTGSKSVTDNSAGTGSSVVTDNPRIGNSENLKAEADQCVAPCNIFPEGNNRLREASASELKAGAVPPKQ